MIIAILKRKCASANTCLKCLLSMLLLLLCSHKMKAQLCTGSLGDPVVSIDFGSGTASFGGALASGTTTYSYVAQAFPSDGSYTVESSTAASGTVWWSTTDHTGGGYMMVVNAATSVQDYFYKKTVTGLCGGTTYEFAAWVVNLLRSQDNNPPNVTFSILSTDESTTYGTYTTGSIPLTSGGAVWKQFGFYFTTPAGVTDVEIKISNSSPGGAPANDLALDDITFRACGPTVTAYTSDGASSKEVCKDDATVFTFNGTVSSGYTDPAYQWQVSTDRGTTWTDISGATGTTYVRQPTTAGTYLYRMSAAASTNIGSSACRVSSNTITIQVDDNPDPQASSNNPGCEGDNLELSASSFSGATYSWTGPNGFTSSLQNPVINNVTDANNGDYIVTLTTAVGCTNKDTTSIAVNPAPEAHAGDDQNMCEGASVTLEGSGGSTYLWSPSATITDPANATTNASPADTTSYILTVSNGTCKAYDTVTVNVWKLPTANAGEDQRIFEGEAAQLAGTAGGTAISYAWTPVYNITDASILQPIVTPTENTTYTLTVTSNLGCGDATDDVYIRVYKTIIIPNAFSPNGDGINDTWKIAKLDTYPEAIVNVFNRYGQVVFHSQGYGTEWDGTYNGKPLPVGTYYYTIDLKIGFGTNPSGWVVILR